MSQAQLLNLIKIRSFWHGLQVHGLLPLQFAAFKRPLCRGNVQALSPAVLLSASCLQLITTTDVSSLHCPVTAGSIHLSFVSRLRASAAGRRIRVTKLCYEPWISFLLESLVLVCMPLRVKACVTVVSALHA